MYKELCSPQAPIYNYYQPEDKNNRDRLLEQHNKSYLKHSYAKRKLTTNNKPN